MKLLVLQGQFVRSRLLPEKRHLLLERHQFHDSVHDAALESMLWVPQVQAPLLLVVLEVEVLVVDPVVELILKSTTTMIKAHLIAPMKMFLCHLRTTRKLVSIYAD